MIKLTHEAMPVHGMRWREERDLSWVQYWRGIQHIWRWRGIVVWRALRMRDRPLHELIRQIAS